MHYCAYDQGPPGVGSTGTTAAATTTTRWCARIRRDSRRSRGVNFVETHLLAQFRDARVPMRRMRPVVERLRASYGPYPLACARAYALDRELVRAVQDEVGLPKGLAIVEELRTGQLTLTPPARAFFATSEFDDVRVHPDDALLGADERALSAELAGDIDPHAVVKRLAPLGRANAVRFDPDFSFGEPTVLGRNLRTDVLAEAVRAGDSVAAVAHAWSLSIHAVEQAVGWEEARTAA